MNTYTVRFKATPMIGSPNFGKFAGAYCTIWVLSDSEASARERAIDHAAAAGWQFAHLEVILAKDREFWVDDAEFVERFDRAQRDGIAARFDAYESRSQDKILFLVDEVRRYNGTLVPDQ